MYLQIQERGPIGYFKIYLRWHTENRDGTDPLPRINIDLIPVKNNGSDMEEKKDRIQFYSVTNGNDWTEKDFFCGGTRNVFHYFI